jgi:hypothetical protein
LIIIYVELGFYHKLHVNRLLSTGLMWFSSLGHAKEGKGQHRLEKLLQ